MHIDLVALASTIGIIGVTAIVFAESGLFFGFFLPGDSLLFTVGLLATQGFFSLPVLLIALPIAAILGDSVGFWFGKKVGPALFKRKGSRFFNPKHVEDAHYFFVKHGKKALVLARFIPIFRTFVPIVAGVAKMPYKDFITYNIIGGIGWTCSITLLGYFLGSVIPRPERYLYPIVALIIIVSFLPVVWEYWKGKRGSRKS